MLADLISSVHRWETDWIVALQSIPHLRRVLRVLSGIGQGSIPYVLPFIYLCVSRSLGAQLYLLTASNSCLVWLLKTGLHLPRPFWLDVRVKLVEQAGYYGLPSGHVQGATVLWLYIALQLRRWWAWLGAGFLIGSVALARLYFGVHFISDAFGGLVAGAALIAAFAWAQARFSNRVKALSTLQQVLVAALVTGGILLLGILPASLVPLAEPDPAAFWFHPRMFRPLLGPAGTFLLTAVTLILANRWLPFEMSGPLWHRGVRCVFALAGLEVFQSLWSWIPSPEEKMLRYALAAVKSASVPFWIFLGAPWVLRGAGFLRLPCDPSSARLAPVKAGALRSGQSGPAEA